MTKTKNPEWTYLGHFKDEVFVDNVRDLSLLLREETKAGEVFGNTHYLLNV